MRRLLTAILVLILLALHLMTLGKVTQEKNSFSQTEADAFVVPSPLLKITALEFDGLVSDILFLQVLVFRGKKMERRGADVLLSESEGKWMFELLQVATDLDPYFVDPYYFANANLTWGPGLIKETNVLLEKGSRYRDWDWLLPFFAGFNYFYFLQENDKAAEYLFESSRRPGASPILASLAARVAFKENRTESAIIFLNEILLKTEDNVLKKKYENRLEALRGILVLEKAIESYRSKTGRTPTTMKELVNRHIIAKIPREPYGGNYYIDSQGQVKTTSESMLMPYRH